MHFQFYSYINNTNKYIFYYSNNSKYKFKDFLIFITQLLLISFFFYWKFLINKLCNKLGFNKYRSYSYIITCKYIMRIVLYPITTHVPIIQQIPYTGWYIYGQKTNL